MASEVITSAGASISMTASEPATNDAAGYAALTFTPIGEVTEIPEFGREYNEVTHIPLATRATVKRKGSFNDGTYTITGGRDVDDAGQTLLAAALASDADHYVKVETQQGEIFYMAVQVMSYKTNIGNADQIVNFSAVLSINSEKGIITVAPA